MAQGTRSMQKQNEGREGGIRRERESAANTNDLVYHLKQFAEENPSSAALWCFVIGFIVGWKLKPW
jgi:hypothetical protein